MLIKQPDNEKTTTSVGAIGIEWSKNFGKLTSEKFHKAQMSVDQDCIRFMKPYTPFKYGFLEQSATVGTVIGSGEIHQIVPYAHYMYYGKVYGPNIPIEENGTVIGFFSPPGRKKHPTGEDLKYNTDRHPLAGPFWFERMVADRKGDILQGAAKAVGGKAE